MKFVMDERVKHRLTGLVVIISIASIFVPAIVKKSNHHFEENVTLSVNLPAKPVPPKVVIKDEKELFRSVKVAKIDLPTKAVAPHVIQISKAEPLNTKSIVPVVPMQKKAPVLAKAETVAKAAKKAAVAPKQLAAKSVVVKKATYAVQLASFAQQENAKSLVSRLRSKGYVASYNKTSNKNGEFYKVVVGQVSQRDEAQHLQQQLAAKLQLHGFIVKTGVS